MSAWSVNTLITPTKIPSDIAFMKVKKLQYFDTGVAHHAAGYYGRSDEISGQRFTYSSEGLDNWSYFSSQSYGSSGPFVRTPNGVFVTTGSTNWQVGDSFVSKSSTSNYQIAGAIGTTLLQKGFVAPYYVRYSLNDGVTWSNSNLSGAFVAYIFSKGSTVFAHTTNGICSSSDGITWTLHPKALEDAERDVPVMWGDDKILVNSPAGDAIHIFDLNTKTYTTKAFETPGDHFYTAAVVNGTPVYCAWRVEYVDVPAGSIELTMTTDFEDVAYYNLISSDFGPLTIGAYAPSYLFFGGNGHFTWGTSGYKVVNLFITPPPPTPAFWEKLIGTQESL